MSVTADTNLADWARLDQLDFYKGGMQATIEALNRLRREEPVFWYEPGEFWVLSRYEDVRHVWRHPELFSSEFGTLVGDNGDLDAMAAQLPEWAKERLSQEAKTRAQHRHIISIAKMSLGHPEIENFIIMDPPRHDEVRRIFTKAMSAPYVRRLRQTITDIVDEILDEIEPGSTHDFVTAVAAQVPTALIASMLGVPQDIRGKFMGWADAFIRSVSLMPDSDPEVVAQTTAMKDEFVAYVSELVDDRRANPRDDVTSKIVNADLDGESVSHAMALMYLTSIIIGGSDTSKHVMSFLALALAEHPEQRQLVLDRPELVPNAVEETLRFYPVVWANCRTAMERMEIGGKTIERDDYVVVSVVGGNRDEEVWDRPDEFDITRSFDPSHLGFGYGQHSCPGATLARLDTAIVMERMLARFPNWELAGPAVTDSSLFMNGIEELPIRFLD